MAHKKVLSEIRREYGQKGLSEETLCTSPIDQFRTWFEEVLQVESIDDPTAMVLSTIDESGHPDSRIVLLKGIENDAFVFYTNYQSKKSMQLEKHPFVALNFYWQSMSRQVRVRGQAERVSIEQSKAYFFSRPLSSQISAIISPQSQKISSRKFLEEAYYDLNDQIKNGMLEYPQFWGGYRVIPQEIEFWQGRNDRLHDRILYSQSEKNWNHSRLAP